MLGFQRETLYKGRLAYLKLRILHGIATNLTSGIITDIEIVVEFLVEDRFIHVSFLSGSFPFCLCRFNSISVSFW